MIRIVTFEDYEPKVIKDLCRVLYTAFAVGTEHKGTLAGPAGEVIDAHEVLKAGPAVQAYADDKILYLTNRKLLPRALPSGEAPTYGLSQYNGQRAIVSSAHLKGTHENANGIARFALHELGQTWGVHHCLDVRCAMYPHWTPSYVLAEPIFCTFCRAVSEQRVSLAKS